MRHSVARRTFKSTKIIKVAFPTANNGNDRVPRDIGWLKNPTVAAVAGQGAERRTTNQGRAEARLNDARFNMPGMYATWDMIPTTRPRMAIASCHALPSARHPNKTNILLARMLLDEIDPRSVVTQ